MKEMPWQDIISDADWSRLVSQFKHGLVASTARQKKWYQKNFSLPTYIAGLSRQIEHYHKLDKRSTDTLKMRAGMLRMIACQSNMFLAANKIQDKETTKQSSLPDEYAAYKKSLDYTVEKISRRALRKADYIEKLIEHIDQQVRGFTTKQNLFEYLKQKAETSFSGEMVGLNADVIMERMDPWHRPIETKIHSNRKNPVGMTNESEISVAFARWAGADTDAPFFVWLEGHGICTGNYEDLGLLNAIKEGAKHQLSGRVKYDRAATRAVAIQDGSLWSYSMNADHTLQKILFDTMDARGTSAKSDQLMRQSKVPYPVYAYVWSRDGVIFTSIHKGAEIHHSSLEAGRKVRCSGMISVQQGKVRSVDNNSGHYKPQTHHLKNFIRFLKSGRVIAPNARIRDEVANKSYSVQEFLGRPSIPSKVGRPTMTQRAKPSVPDKAGRPSIAQLGLSK